MTELDRIPDWMQPETTRQIDLKSWAQEFRDVYAVAEALSKTPFVPREMMGKQADVAAAIMKGRELGLDPFDALGSIYIVHGRVGYYAEFMRRRIIQAGHTLRIIENTDSRCIVEGIRKDGGDAQRATFTAEQARKAGIDLGKYPADKLVARATSRLCRQVFPDVLSGTLIAEDLMDGLIPADETPEAAPAGKPALQRKRATKAAKAASTQPAPAPAEDRSDELAELLGDQPDGRTDTEREADEQAQWQRDEGVPDTRGEPDEPEPLPLDEPITPAQLKLLLIRFRERGFTDQQRQERLDYCIGLIGRQITSSKELTSNEASRIIDSLEN